MTALKSICFLIFVAGLFAGCIPFAFLPAGPRIMTAGFSFLSFPPWLIGAFILLWCFRDFRAKGRGTPAPIDPPKELVVTGLYRHVRNPM